MRRRLILAAGAVALVAGFFVVTAFPAFADGATHVTPAQERLHRDMCRNLPESITACPPVYVRHRSPVAARHSHRHATRRGRR